MKNSSIKDTTRIAISFVTTISFVCLLFSAMNVPQANASELMKDTSSFDTDNYFLPNKNTDDYFSFFKTKKGNTLNNSSKSYSFSMDNKLFSFDSSNNFSIPTNKVNTANKEASKKEEKTIKEITSETPTIDYSKAFNAQKELDNIKQERIRKEEEKARAEKERQEREEAERKAAEKHAKMGCQQLKELVPGSVSFGGEVIPYVSSWRTESAPANAAGFWWGDESPYSGTFTWIGGHNPGVFHKLMDVQTGDTIDYCSRQGERRTYTVIEIQHVLRTTKLDEVIPTLEKYGEHLLLQCCVNKTYYRLVFCK